MILWMLKILLYKEVSQLNIGVRKTNYVHYYVIDDKYFVVK